MRDIRSRPLLALLGLLLVLVVAGCGDEEEPATEQGGGGQAATLPGEGKPSLTIGTKDFTEEFVLGELYTRALEAKGYTVNLKRNIGATEIIDQALTSGEIDAYPEYTGVALSVTFGKDVVTKSPEDTAQRVKALYEERGQVVSELTPFQDTDAIATTKEFAQQNNLTTVADLKNLDSFSVGARPEFRNRFNGLKGMRQVYGIENANFKQLALGLQYQALDKGDVDTANVFSTDAQLATGKYQVLEDPEGVFGFQNVYFVINRDKYEALGGEEFMSVINDVNALLTEEAMTSMNAAVDIDKREAGDVAQAFLEANGLV